MTPLANTAADAQQLVRAAWQATGGIQTYWDGEASTVTQSKPQLKDLTLKLHRLTALVPVTEELLEDAPAMAGYVTSKAGENVKAKFQDNLEQRLTFTGKHLDHGHTWLYKAE